jgi:hypothetical protein
MIRWMNLGISGQCGWPDKSLEVKFGDSNLVLMPRTKENSASVHIQVRGHNHLPEMTLVNQFLSVVSWSYKDSLQNHYGWSGNPIPVPVPARNLAHSINPYFLVQWNPLPEPKQRLAVALYREAMTVNSLPYQFLGFFKIINILHKNGPTQVDWIRATLPKMVSPTARERIDTLSKSEPDVAKYLYESGRCAIAHAFSDPLIDPDDLTHLRRLSEDLGVARSLAEYLIAHELHVPAYP